MKNLLSFSLLLSFILFNLTVQAQTDYTWDGSTDTDFATADNWTPSGVPGSGDNITIVTGSNTCQLDGNRTVNKVTVTSGTLDLETYTLTVSDRSTLNGGTMEDGKLLMTTGTAVFNGTTMDCKVDVTANITKVYDTHFKDTVLLDEVSTGNGYYTHGNIFEKYTEITNNSTGYIYVANTAPDTFRVNAVFNLEAAGFFIIGQGATTVHFEDDVVLNNHSGNTGRGFSIGGNASSAVDFLGDIEMNVTTGSGYIAFNLGTITHHGQLTVGSEGYHSGTLTLKGYRQNAATAVDLSPLEDDARITLGPDLELEGDLTCPALYTKLESGCEFNGDVTIADLRTWNGAIFHGVTDLTVTTGNVYTGGNMFNDTASITNNGTGYLNNGDIVADTFNLPVTFNLEAAGYITLGNSGVSNYYADKVTLNNHSGNSTRRISIGGNASVSNVFDGEIELNVEASSGDIRFWLGTTHNGLLTIGSEGYNNGTLTLRNYEQTASGTIDLSGIGGSADLDVLTGADITADFIYGGGGTATLTDAVFQGDVTIESSSLPVTDCTFHGTTYLEKTGGVNNLNDGNAFHGPVTIENSSTSNYLYWGNAVADTFKMDLTLINRSSQPLWINYSSEGELGGDLTLDGDSAAVIRIGSSTAGRKVVFNGSTDQHISILEADLDVQVYRMEVDKPSGRLLIDGTLDISHELGLTNGIIGLEESTMLILQDGLEPTATDTSYVEGPVKKIGNDAFDFPVGSNGYYRPISISAPSNATDAFSAQHINEDSDPTYEHDDKESSINRIGTNEYWTLDRDAGTSDVTVTLSWDEMSCGFDTLANLRIVAWNDTIWKDLGNGGTTGNTNEGTIHTSGASSTYGAYAIGTIDTLRCLGDASCFQQPTQLGERDTCIQGLSFGSNNDKWFRFKASETSVTFSLFRNYGENSLINHECRVYSTCGSDSLPRFVMISDSISEVFFVSNLTKDEYYYLHLSKDAEDDGSKKYNICVQYDEDSFALRDEVFASVSGSACYANQNSEAYEDKYNVLSTHIPSGNTEPTKTIGVNFNIFQDGNGAGNFQSPAQDGGVDQSDLQMIFGWFREHYTNVQSPTDHTITGVTNLDDSRIDFELVGVYFYNNSSVYYSTSTSTLLNEVANGVDGDPSRLNQLNVLFNGAAYNKKVVNVTVTSGGSGYTIPPTVTFSPPCGATATAILDVNGSVVSVDVTNGGSVIGDPNITVVFTSNDNGSGAAAVVELGGGAAAFAGFPSYTNPDANSSLVMLNATSNPDPSSFYQISSTMAHEVGHNLGLYHTYYGGGASANCNSTTDYLSDIFGAFPPGSNCPHLSSWSSSFLTNTPPKVTNNLMGGNQNARYISPLQMGWMHRTLALGNMRKYVVGSPYTTEALVIVEDEEWDFDIRLYRDIVVEPGVTLTISCEVYMADQAKIIVKPGAMLVVDGGLISGAHLMWQGIEVWGDPNSPRDVTLPSAQGILELKNGAIIENAHLGVYLGKDGQGNCCSHSGGIIKSAGGSTASDRVVFRNNRKHVAFMAYDHPSGSYFTRTDFICDAPLQDEDAYPDQGTQQFVSIWAQDGISFTDCKFENSLTGQTGEFGELHRGQGIRAVDAQVYVYSSAHSGSDYYTQFNGLTSGIHSTRTINAAKLYLDDALFDNTLMGVLSEGSIFDKIHSNKFSVPQPDDLSVTGYGVYMFDEINHSIDSCLFGSYDSQNEGLRGYVCHGTDDPMFNSGGLAWKNVFDGLLVGTQTERYNRTLQLRCNYYDTDNTVDWWVNPETTWGVLGPQGLSCQQEDYRAENVFNDASSGVEHIATNVQPFEYYGSGATGTIPNSSESAQNFATQNCLTPNDESCDEDPIILNPDYPDTQTALFRVAQQDTALDVLQAEMDTLKVYLDSSMTDTLLVHIADTNYNNQTLTDELIQYSFLSDTVMNATCSRIPFFTAPQFQDIVVVNSPVNEKVWPFLSDALDGFDDKDSAYRDTILSAQGSDSLRTSGAIERDMALAHTQRFGGIATMLNYYTAYDTVPDSTYALIHFLADSLPDKQWNRVAVGVALKADTTSWARSILDSIPQENADDSTFYDYYDLAISLKEDTLTWFDVDSTQRSLVDNIASGTSSVKYRAEAVQMLLDDTVFVRIPEQIPQSPSGKRGHEEPNPEELASQTSLKVYPNPFQNQFNVAWELEGDAAQLQFDVFDLTGRLVHTELTQATKFGTYVLNLGECNGFYILRVSENGKQLYQEKLLCLGQ